MGWEVTEKNGDLECSNYFLNKSFTIFIKMFSVRALPSQAAATF
tara:strand:+ start:287 stop:418 length:132 start_codon:yes stop_codon:yes gene_type:complete